MRPKPIDEDIEDEEKGAKHYTARAKQFPKFGKKFHSMKKDEKKHSRYLKKMNVGPSEEAREKMLGKVL